MKTSLLNLGSPAERLAPQGARSQARPQEDFKAPGGPQTAAVSSPPAETSSAPLTPASTASSEDVDFELVFGRRQLASTGLVLMVALAVFSGFSYVIGKASGAKAAGAPAAVSVEAVPAPKPLRATPVPTVTPASATAPPAPAGGTQNQAPVFAEAAQGKVYIQVGAVDKGLAGIWAEGLRTHNLQAFVSPGPSDKSWRVLVGPLPDPQSFQHAKDTLDALGISTFGKRYADEPAVKPQPAPAPAAAATASDPAPQPQTAN